MFNEENVNQDCLDAEEFEAGPDDWDKYAEAPSDEGESEFDEPIENNPYDDQELIDYEEGPDDWDKYAEAPSDEGESEFDEPIENNPYDDQELTDYEEDPDLDDGYDDDDDDDGDNDEKDNDTDADDEDMEEAEIEYASCWEKQMRIRITRTTPQLPLGEHSATVGVITAEQTRTFDGDTCTEVIIPFAIKNNQRTVTIPFRASLNVSPQSRLYAIIQGILGYAPQDGFNLGRLQGRQVKVGVSHFMDEDGNVWDQVNCVRKAG